MQDLDNAATAFETLKSAFERFKQLDNQMVPFSREQRIEFDTLGDLLCDVRKFAADLAEYAGN